MIDKIAKLHQYAAYFDPGVDILVPQHQAKQAILIVMSIWNVNLVAITPLD